MTRAEADEHLAQAIRAHAAAYDLSRDDELLSDYVVVAHWQRIQTDDRSRYSVHLPRPETPSHVVVGLLYAGINGSREVDDDDND